MSDISNFLNQLSRINWFEKSGTPTEEYHVIYSIFEAYDGWSQQMFKAADKLDKGIFENIHMEIG
ncbi:hypothetical protein [Zhenhengia yiwuensis]|uniref:hypothetical protein n=1 Tax=Zhenhengia yiwuensis TaxID=2763666 RepID=UPI002A75B4D5|nr:hypothetical protein [Zhenhengia yiwuensis]MDY3367502.1 hypothetical protein [Zhenhengia yiwuensis]